MTAILSAAFERAAKHIRPGYQRYVLNFTGQDAQHSPVQGRTTTVNWYAHISDCLQKRLDDLQRQDLSSVSAVRVVWKANVFRSRFVAQVICKPETITKLQDLPGFVSAEAFDPARHDSRLPRSLLYHFNDTMKTYDPTEPFVSSKMVMEEHTYRTGRW